MIDVNIEYEEKGCMIRVNGEIDASSSIHLDKAIHEAVEKKGIRYILIDCKGLNYISSAGLGVFMSYIQVLKESKLQMVIFNLSHKVYKVFEILGLHNLLTIVDSEEEAKQVTHGV
jgi:anti-sigma B factor antagonist